jgi:hypothetical protein
MRAGEVRGRRLAAKSDVYSGVGLRELANALVGDHPQGAGGVALEPIAPDDQRMSLA